MTFHPQQVQETNQFAVIYGNQSDCGMRTTVRLKATILEDIAAHWEAMIRLAVIPPSRLYAQAIR